MRGRHVVKEKQMSKILRWKEADCLRSGKKQCGWGVGNKGGRAAGNERGNCKDGGFFFLVIKEKGIG